MQLQHDMAYQYQHKNLDSRDISIPSARFIAGCVVVFVAGVLTTAYFCVSMGYEMKMPGDWKMSMMWMRMPGQTWLMAMLSFLLMWVAMMVAMMMPSALPMFLKTRRHPLSLFYMASGYFTIWLVAGFGICVLGVAFNDAAMGSEFLSRAVPLIAGVSLIATGIFQFTPWKMTHLLRCRSSYGCATSCPQHEASFRLGCKQGVACCVCCSSLMTIQLILGIMNPLVMVIVAIIITAEKLLPRPDVTARFVGITGIVVGILMTLHWATLSHV